MPRQISKHLNMGGRGPRGVQLFAALLIACLLSLLYLSRPIDEIAWAASYATMEREPSGRIVLVDIDMREAVSSQSVATRQARALRALERLDPEAVFIEGRFEASDPGIPDLAAAIEESALPVTVGWPVERRVTGGRGELFVDRRANLPGAREAADIATRSAFGYVFSLPAWFDAEGKRFATFSGEIAGEAPHEEFFVDYRYLLSSFRVEQLKQIEHPQYSAALEGKRVLILAASGELGSEIVIPWAVRTQRVVASIIGAETLVSGELRTVPWPLPLIIVFLGLIASNFLARRSRCFVYAACLLSVLAAPFAALCFDLIVPIGTAWLLCLAFFAMRARSVWKERAANIDKISSLPNFNALAAEFGTARGQLVVARVERFEEILASLEPEQHRSFIQQIAMRLSIARDTRIYTDTNGHFAWFDDLDQARSHVGSLLALASAPMQVGERTLDFACSFGVLDTRIDKPRQGISATVVAAEIATGRSSHLAYVSEQGENDASWQLALHAELDRAITEEQIYLVYQPQCDLSSGEIVGAEALVRWHHPDRGEITPAEFIPQIERAGRLKPLTAYTLRLASGIANSAAPSKLRISVNISATLLADDDFVALIVNNVGSGAAKPEAITLEITETARIADFRCAARNLESLRRLGFHVSLDDFGTGEANLSLLVSLPCNELKIDRSFVALARQNERARMIIQALAETARLAKMRLVAEGIETQAELHVITTLGCQIGQGFLYGLPLSAADFLAQLGASENAHKMQLTLS